MLRCFDGSFYVGVTNDLERRFAQHQDGVTAGCYTHSRRPLRLDYAASFDRVGDAFAWEKRLKSWSLRKKRALADSDWQSLKRYSRSGPFASDDC
jgi:putative endonuclease